MCFRPSHLLLGVILFFLTLFPSLQGIYWDLGVHPDEIAIANFQHNIERNGHLRLRAYPTGWFELYGLKQFVQKTFSAKLDASKRRFLTQEGHYTPAPVANFNASAFIQDARLFNAFLLALSCILLYASSLQAHLHPAAAFFGALFLGLHPVPIEFAHYCETDIALVFSLSLSALLCTCTLCRRSALFYAFSMVAIGFAITCKFTLVPLAILCPAHALFLVAPSTRPTRQKILLAAALVVLGLLLMVFGAMIGIPTLYKEFALFREMMGETSRLTYEEILFTLGRFKDAPWSNEIFTLGCMVREAAFLGLLPCLLLFASIASLFRQGFRKHLLGLPLFLLLFLLLAPFSMPFFRRQEALPILVVFASILPFFIESTLRAFKTHRDTIPRVLASVSTVLLVALFVSTALSSQRMASAFRRHDTLLDAKQTLETSLQRDAQLFLDTRLGPVLRGCPFPNPKGIRLDHAYPLTKQEYTNTPSAYYLRNAAYRGREPSYSLFTGSLLPDIQQSVSQFETESTLLRSWKMLPGRIRPVFGQPDIELWYLHGFAPSPKPLDLPLYSPRPIVALPASTPFHAPHVDHAFGTSFGLCLSSSSSRIYRSNPSTRSWLVVRYITGKTPISLQTDGKGIPSTQSLRPGETTLVELPPPSPLCPLYSTLSPFKVKARNLSPDDLCVATLSSDPAEVAFLLRTAGNPSLARSFLMENGFESNACTLQLLLAKIACADPLSESELRPLASFRDALTHATNATSIAGVPIGAVRDFAVLHTPLSHLNLLLPSGTWRGTLHAPAPLDESILQQPLFSVPATDLQQTTPQTLTFTLHLSAPTTLLSAANLPFTTLDLTWDPLSLLSPDIERLLQHEAKCAILPL